MKKKIVAVLICGAIAAGMAGCGSAVAENVPQVIEVEGSPGSDVTWTYSIIEADSSEITEDALAEWYFDYVEPSGHDWDVIVYSDQPDMGVHAQFDLVKKDVYLETDNNYHAVAGDDLQATYYLAVDGELIVSAEPGED